jgi:division protein CdvB (Snf7/Vps24/ESCRT-III family)
MTPEQQQALQEHIQAIAKILYEDTPVEQLTTLAGIEQAVRSQMQKHVMPEIGVFLSQLPQAQAQATNDESKAYWENSPSPADKPKS